MPGTSASGRRGLPKEMKELKGTLRKHRVRDAPNPDIATDDEMRPPKFLDAAGKKEYKAKAELLKKLGVFREGDNVALAAYASAYSQWKAGMEDINANGIIVTDFKGAKVQNPAVLVVNKALDAMRHFIVEFGLTPASRQRLKVEKKEEKNEWDMFGEKPAQPPVVVSTNTTLEVQ